MIALTTPTISSQSSYLANTTRPLELTRKVNGWANKMLNGRDGAFTQPVPSSGTELPNISTTTSLSSSYVRAPIFSNAQSTPTTELLQSWVPPGSVVVEVPGLALPNANTKFSTTQANAITSALSARTLDAFSSLRDDRQKILARTLMLVALRELSQGLIEPSELKFVVAQIYKVSSSALLPTLKAKVNAQRQNAPVPEATRVPSSGASVKKGPDRTAVARRIIDAKPNTIMLQEEQKAALTKILVKTWELEQRAGSTKLGFEAYIRNAKANQWTDWIDSAQDMGVQVTTERWESSLTPMIGNASTLIADIKLAFPQDPTKRAQLANLVQSGSSLQQGIAQIRSISLELKEVRSTGDTLISNITPEPVRNKTTLGPEKLHKEFPTRLANLIDATAPSHWFAIKNSAGNWSIRLREKVGAPYLPFATVKVPKSPAGAGVFTISYTQEKTPSDRVIDKRLNPPMIEEINKRFGVGKWTARIESPISVGILVKDQRKGYVSTKEGEAQRYIEAKRSVDTRLEKTMLTQSQIQKVNELSGSTKWYLRADASGRLVAFMPLSGRLVARFYPEIKGNATAYRLIPVTLGTPQVGTYVSLPKEIVSLCDAAFGEGTYRANFIRPGYFQVQLKVNLTSMDQSSYLGSVTLETDPRSGTEKWVLRKKRS